MAEFFCLLVGMNVGAAYAAWLLGGWPMVQRLARLLPGDSNE